MIKRIGLLTSGGDCQALNATMRGVVKGLSNSVENLEVWDIVTKKLQPEIEKSKKFLQVNL